MPRNQNQLHPLCHPELAEGNKGVCFTDVANKALL